MGLGWQLSGAPRGQLSDLLTDHQYLGRVTGLMMGCRGGLHQISYGMFSRRTEDRKGRDQRSLQVLGQLPCRLSQLLKEPMLCVRRHVFVHTLSIKKIFIPLSKRGDQGEVAGAVFVQVLCFLTEKIGVAGCGYMCIEYCIWERVLRLTGAGPL